MGLREEFGDFFTPREPIPRSLYLILTLGGFAFFLVIWSILTYGGLIDPLFLPSPGRVFQAGWDLFADFSFTTDIFNSVYRVMVGFIAAAVIGVPLGLIMGTFKASRGRHRAYGRFYPLHACLCLHPPLHSLARNRGR